MAKMGAFGKLTLILALSLTAAFTGSTA